MESRWSKLLSREFVISMVVEGFAGAAMLTEIATFEQFLMISLPVLGIYQGMKAKTATAP